jgi:hypothetical protein
MNLNHCPDAPVDLEVSTTLEFSDPFKHIDADTSTLLRVILGVQARLNSCRVMRSSAKNRSRRSAIRTM